MLDFNGLCKFNNIFIYNKTFSCCAPKAERPHVGLYNHIGRLIELFQMKWLNGG